MAEESFEASQRPKNPKAKKPKNKHKHKNKKHKAGIQSDHPGWLRPIEKSEASQCPQLPLGKGSLKSTLFKGGTFFLPRIS